MRMSKNKNKKDKKKKIIIKNGLNKKQRYILGCT